MAWYVQVGNGNRKVGGWSTRTNEESCSPTCHFKGQGCYAEFGPLSWQWRKANATGMVWGDFCRWVKSLPAGTIWRHNDAGDLPHTNGTIDRELCLELARANKGRLGYTYTHHNVYGSSLQARKNRNTLRRLRRLGFVVSLSTESGAQADAAFDMGIGPVVLVVESDSAEQGHTPKGRRWFVCPHQLGKVASCVECRICALPGRLGIVAFQAHGVKRNSLPIVKG